MAMSGMEMAMQAVFKWMGLDPKETVAMFFGARDAAISANERLGKIEVALQENRAMLELILKRLSGEKTNGVVTSEQSGLAGIRSGEADRSNSAGLPSSADGSGTGSPRTGGSGSGAQ